MKSQLSQISEKMSIEDQDLNLASNSKMNLPVNGEISYRSGQFSIMDIPQR